MPTMLEYHLLNAARRALRSYEFGNASGELAKEVADAIEQHLASPALPSPQQAADKSEGVNSGVFAVQDPSPLPVDEKFTVYLDDEGDFIVQLQRETGLIAHGSTLEDAIWKMREVLDMAKSLKPDLLAALPSPSEGESQSEARSWDRPSSTARRDIVGERKLADGSTEYLMHNEALCNPYYLAVSAPALSEPVAGEPERCERCLYPLPNHSETCFREVEPVAGEGIANAQTRIQGEESAHPYLFDRKAARGGLAPHPSP